jgi:hypothetical protein
LRPISRTDIVILVLVVSIYPDHNVVIEALDAPAEYREALNRLAVTCAMGYAGWN